MGEWDYNIFSFFAAHDLAVTSNYQFHFIRFAKRPTFLRKGKAMSLMHSLHADGHMGILHLKDQGKNVPSEQLAALRMVRDDDTKAAIANETFAAKGTNLKECSDFRADKEDGKKSASFDRTGVLAVGCRHGFVLAMCNLFTGE